MKMSKLFPTKFLKAVDLEGPVDVTIKVVYLERMPTTNDEKPVVYFEEMAGGLVLNKGNAATIAEICGSDESLNWTGKRVCLFPTTCDLKGKTVGCLRVRAVEESIF